MNIKERIAVERRLIRHLVRVMKQNGWEAVCVDDGGEFVKTTCETEVLDAVFSVDDSHIFFKKNGKKHSVFIVLGNDGWDAIADYTTALNDADGFGEVMNKVNEYADYMMENECRQ